MEDGLQLLLVRGGDTTNIMKSTNKLENASTLRTVKSSDGLLASDDEDSSAPIPTNPSVRLAGAMNDEKEERTAQESALSVWDCRAVHWPPYSPAVVLKRGYAYAQSPPLLVEVLFLGAFVLICYVLPGHLVKAHQRPIPYHITSNGDTLIDLTFDNDYHKNETIPGSMLNLLCVLFPILVFWILGNFVGPRGDTHAALCMYLLTMGMKIFIVECIKNYAGYLRPSFYNMCQFNPATLVCDNENTSARESFPSGHAATALSSMTLLSLYLLGKVVGGTKQRGIVVGLRNAAVPLLDHDNYFIWTPSLLSKALSVFAIAPIGLGMFIATSRVRDNWHHPADILCGGIIGACCALFAHSLWYPSVYSYYAGIPLSTVNKILVAKKAKAKLAPRLELDLA